MIRRGTNAERTAGGGVVFALGELIYVTDTDALYIGDGVTPGGILLADQNSGGLSSAFTAESTQVKLEKDLNLNGQDIVGTGNINISGNITATGNIDIGDNTGDTVTITAQVDSNITPTIDNTFNLGTLSKRWQNVYASGLSVDGQIDAVSINANTVADNSAVMVNVATNTFTGNLTGNVDGNVDGDVTGNLTGNVTGRLDGDVTGSVFADNSTTLVDGVAGVLRGDHYGSLYGSVKALNNGFTILNPGTDGTDASIVATLVGNVTGNVNGNVQGNVVGNTTGSHTGDVKGSVFADDSTILVDAVAGIVPGSVISGTVTANLVGNVQGNLTGDVTGNIFTNLIDSVDSTAIIVTPTLQANADIIASQSIVVGSDENTEAVVINNDGQIFANTLTVNFIGSRDAGFEVGFTNNVKFDGTAFFTDDLISSNIIRATNFDSLNTTGTQFTVETYIGPDDTQESINDPLNYTSHAKVTPSKAEFGVPVKFVVVADDTARTTLVPTPEKGMVILMEAGTTPAATNQLQFYNGTNWVNV